MAQITVKVNGRDFLLGCPDGQEGRIRRLAQYIDAKIGEFSKTIGPVGEARLILLAALVIADELSDVNDALQQERNRAPSAAASPDSGAGKIEAEQSEAAAAGILAIAERIEAIAARLETT